MADFEQTSNPNLCICILPEISKIFNGGRFLFWEKKKEFFPKVLIVPWQANQFLLVTGMDAYAKSPSIRRGSRPKV